MEVPEIHILNKIAWQLFGTMTFKKAYVPDGQRLKMWFALVRTLAKWHHVYFKQLLWVLRYEQGEATGRPHFHCLIGGLPKAALAGQEKIMRENGTWDVTNRTCHALHAKWAKMGLNPNDSQDRISQWSIYDDRLNGSAYILKCLVDDESRIFKDIYETGKFSNLEDRQLILSDSVIQVVQSYLTRNAVEQVKIRKRIRRGD